MGQDNSLVTNLINQGYISTTALNIFKHKHKKQFIKVSHYPFNSLVHLHSYYVKRQEFSKQNNNFVHYLQLKNFMTTDRPSDMIGCSNSFLSLTKSTSKTQCISFATQVHQNSLDKQISNRSYYHFEQRQLWSVFCGCIMGAYQLIRAGFKEPILSPKAIFLNEEGFVKVGEWQFVNSQQDKQKEELTINDPLLKKTDILQNYYWAPQGPLIIEQTLCLGNSMSRKIGQRKSQIFSLGMTLLNMILRKPLYQVQTYSETEVQKYLCQAIKLRENNNSALSKYFIQILRRMLIWDYKQRATYQELYDIAVEYFHQQNKLINFEQQLNKQNNQGQISNISHQISQNMKKQLNSSPIVPGQGDTYIPQEQQQPSNSPVKQLQKDEEDYSNLDFYHQLVSDIDELKPDDTLKFQKAQAYGNPHSSRHTFCESGLISKSSFGNINNFATFHQDIFSFQNNRQPLRCIGGQIRNRNKLNEYEKENKIKNFQESEERLFTDPKILEMLKLQPIQYENHMKVEQCHDDLGQTLQLNQNQKNQQNHKQSNSMVTNFDGVTVNSCKNSEYKEYNIVKQTFAKGYYEGEKSQELRNGFGVFYYQDGGKYSGYWLDNKMHGQGTLYYPDNTVAYQGQWFEDELHGKGILYNENPKPVPVHTYDYTSFNECQQYWKSYEGGFSHDNKSGYGILTLSNGQKFQGQFSKDMVNGRGTFYSNEGRMIRGEWKNNILVKVIKTQMI